MHISKPLKRTIPPVPNVLIQVASLQSKIASLENTENFINDLAELQTYIWSKTDLFHWIPVLNRIDQLLETTDSNNVNDLCILLDFTRLLWDNTTNRTLYNSYEHLSGLLQSCYVRVCLSTLRLLLKPAQRMVSQRSLRQALQPCVPYLQVLAQKIQDSNKLDFSFYRDLQTESSSSPSVDECPKPDSRSPPTASVNTPQPKKLKMDTNETGLIVIQLTISCADEEAILELWNSLIEKHNVPKDKQFELLHQIRVASFCSNNSKRDQLLEIRFLSIAVLGKNFFSNLSANILNEDQAQYKLFLFEPELVSTLVANIIPDQNIDIQFSALCALDSVSHFRSKLNETLSALNAGANHGMLMQLLRKVLATFSDNDGSYFSQEFIDSFFSFVSFLINTSSGGQMIISAGIVTLLTNAISSYSPTHLKSISKCATMIDTIIYGFPSSLNVFISAGGVDIIVSRIQNEVHVCLELGANFTMEELNAQILDPGADPKYRVLLARMPLLRSLMKLILHLLQSSGTADGMRNIIDSSLPNTLYRIFEKSEIFGHVGAFGLAVNIMSTFIHNEPTSLSILQEAQLPNAFLIACQRPLSISAEVISALPNAFGAICLNSAGLELFEKLNPIDSYLATFTKLEHLRTLLDNDVPHLIGNSIDEFMRHHPSLKETVMKSIVKLLSSVIDLGRAMESIPSEYCHLLTESIPANEINRSQEARMSLFIDVTSRFLEGLFQNTAHCKDFCKFGGIPILLSIFSLSSIPYDFAESPSSYSLSYLFRIIIESSPQDSVNNLVSVMQNAFDKLDPLSKKNVIYEYINVEKNPDISAEAQTVFSALITLKCFIRLLADLYCSHSLSHSKSVNAIIQTFTGSNSTLLAKFATLKQ